MLASDSDQNHGTEVNENWGRELLELFSLGAGNYTEVDVLEASRAFTGWSFETKIPRLPYGRFPWKFEYRPEDHDDGEKTFLGHKGNFNGEHIIDIIVEQPACARFICRHLYNFFVADEPQVPAWSLEPPRDPVAIDLLARTFRENKCETLLYGPGPAQSAVGGRLAYRPGVDQQRLADGAHQLRRRAGR